MNAIVLSPELFEGSEELQQLRQGLRMLTYPTRDFDTKSITVESVMEWRGILDEHFQGWQGVESWREIFREASEEIRDSALEWPGRGFPPYTPCQVGYIIDLLLGTGGDRWKLDVRRPIGKRWVKQ